MAWEMDIQIDGSTVWVVLLVSNDFKTVREVSDLPYTHTHMDANNMEQVFKDFCYTIILIKNVSIKKLSRYKTVIFKYPITCKRVLLYFSDHGNGGSLVMQDGS